MPSSSPTTIQAGRPLRASAASGLPRPQIGDDRRELLGVGRGDRPGPRAAHRQAGQGDPVRGRPCRSPARRRAPRGRPWRRRSRPPRSSTAWGRTAMAGNRSGWARIAAPEADLAALDPVVAPLARAVEEQDGRERLRPVVAGRHEDRVLPLARRRLDRPEVEARALASVVGLRGRAGAGCRCP